MTRDRVCPGADTGKFKREDIMNRKILSRDKACLIVCTVLNPFSSIHIGLLYETTSGYEPIPGAEKIKIDNLFVNLYEQDRRYNLRTLDFIIKTLCSKCRQEGFSFDIEKNELIERKFRTIGELADRLIKSSIPEKKTGDQSAG